MSVTQVASRKESCPEFSSHPSRPRVVPMVTRYSFRFELQLVLENVGFSIESLFGSYDKREFDASGDIIFVARK